MRTPLADRNWYDFYEQTGDTSITNNTVTLKNVRDWNHSTTSVLERTWHDEIEIPIDSVESIWFGLSRFGSTGMSGHSFMSFELTNGTAYVLSIEARREINEQYSAFYGLFNQYELWYGWGTERDFVGGRLFLLDQPIEYYKLNLTPEESQAVFLAVARETAVVYATPQFYNTLWANCTNLLAKTINQSYPGRIPYNIAWNLPGTSVSFLQAQGLINQTIPTETLTQTTQINNHDPALLETINTSPTDFSRQLRVQLDE